MLPSASTDDRRPVWQWGLGGALLALFGWYAFVRGARVPLLGWIDLAIHEFGHLATRFLPEVGSAIMGNGMQTLVPLLLAGVFGFRERDWLGVVLCLGWAATTLQDASVYIADAPHLRLQLIGGYHDWAFVLAELHQLHRAEEIARAVWTVGLLVWIVAVWGCIAGRWIEPTIARPTNVAPGPTRAEPAAPVVPTVPPAGQPGDQPADRDDDWRGFFA